MWPTALLLQSRAISCDELRLQSCVVLLRCPALQLPRIQRSTLCMHGSAHFRQTEYISTIHVGVLQSYTYRFVLRRCRDLMPFAVVNSAVSSAFAVDAMALASDSLTSSCDTNDTWHCILAAFAHNCHSVPLKHASC